MQSLIHACELGAWISQGRLWPTRKTMLIAEWKFRFLCILSKTNQCLSAVFPVIETVCRKINTFSNNLGRRWYITLSKVMITYCKAKNFWEVQNHNGYISCTNILQQERISSVFCSFNHRIQPGCRPDGGRSCTVVWGHSGKPALEQTGTAA